MPKEGGVRYWTTILWDKRILRMYIVTFPFLTMSALQWGPYETNLNVNTRQRLFFSFPKLQDSLLEFIPRKVIPGLPGSNFFVQCPGIIFLAARWSGPAQSASIFSVCLDYILRVCKSLWDSFLYLGKLHWFLYLLLSYFYDPGMFIFRWSSNFV